MEVVGSRVSNAGMKNKRTPRRRRKADMSTGLMVMGLPDYLTLEHWTTWRGYGHNS